MYSEENMLEDNLNDSIGRLIRNLNNRTTWTKRCADIQKQLIDELKKEKYISFRGHPSRYHLFRIGDSCVFEVPKNRQGHLKKFRGEKVRIVCVDSGTFDRGLMAGKIASRE